MLLAEDHVALRPVQRLPMPDAAFQRAADVRRQGGMAAQHLLEHRDRPQPGRGAQHRDNLGVPYRRQWVRAAAAAGRPALRGKPGIGIKPGAGAGADARAGGGNLPGLGPAMVHVQSRLLVGDVRAGHEATPGKEIATSAQTSRNRRQTPDRDRPAGADLRQGYAQP